MGAYRYYKICPFRISIPVSLPIGLGKWQFQIYKHCAFSFLVSKWVYTDVFLSSHLLDIVDRKGPICSQSSNVLTILDQVKNNVFWLDLTRAPHGQSHMGGV